MCIALPSLVLWLTATTLDVTTWGMRLMVTTLATPATTPGMMAIELATLVLLAMLPQPTIPVNIVSLTHMTSTTPATQDLATLAAAMEH